MNADSLEYENYRQYLTDQMHGRTLTPDGLRMICASFDCDPVKIGKHMPEMLAKLRSEGIVEQRGGEDDVISGG